MREAILAGWKNNHSFRSIRSSTLRVGYLNASTKLIKERGYSPASFQTQVQLIKRFDEWLRRGHTEISALDEIVVERFLHRRQSASSARRGDTATQYRFLHVLRDRRAVRRPKKPPLFPEQRLTTNYGRYLLGERGLRQGTVVNYVPFIHQFTSARFQQSHLQAFPNSGSGCHGLRSVPGYKFSPGGVRSCSLPPFGLFFAICDITEKSRPI
jgi:hypothetical protein